MYVQDFDELTLGQARTIRDTLRASKDILTEWERDDHYEFDTGEMRLALSVEDKNLNNMEINISMGYLAFYDLVEADNDVVNINSRSSSHNFQISAYKDKRCEEIISYLDEEIEDILDTEHYVNERAQFRFDDFDPDWT